MDRYMSIGDTAKVLGVVPATVKLMVRSGRLVPAARTVGGIHLFDPADIERLAAARRDHDGRSSLSMDQRATQEDSSER